ncbi:hypothetical protein SH139x_005350 [Planctomycetaceae bacterium SH139]
MMISQFVFSCLLLLISSFWLSANTGGKVNATADVVKSLLQGMRGAAARESAEQLTARVDKIVVAHGDEGITAIRKVGSPALEVIEQSTAEHAAAAVRLMARRGDESLWIVSNRQRLAYFVRHGDDAAEAMIRHRGIAEPLLHEFGAPAARALAKINSQNGRRLAMMARDGDLQRIGRSEALLAVVARYGDRAMAFIWKHKLKLASAAALTAFIANPEAFLQGTQTLAETAVEHSFAPVLEWLSARGIGPLVILGGCGVLVVVLGVRLTMRRISRLF